MESSAWIACLGRQALLLASLGLTAPAWGDERDFLDEPEPVPSIELPAQTPPAATARRGRVIEEIVVTAQKTEQTLQEVPVAVSVVSGETLRQAGVFGPQGLENLVPNLELDTDAQAPTIGIRGFSTDSFNVGLEPSVGIIVDELPLGRSEFIPDGLFDVARVEVLRGPQGTLFGKNTIAGVLIFATGEPESEGTGSLSLTGGDFETRRVEGYQNIPLGERLASRLALVAWTDGGEIENSFLDRNELAFDQFAGRIKLDWDVSDAVLLRAGLQRSETDTRYPGWQNYALDSDALEYAQSHDPATEDDPFNGRNSLDLPGFVKRDTTLAHAIAQIAVTPALDLSVIVGYADLFNDLVIDFDVSAADLVRVTAGFDYDQSSLELRLVGDANWLGLPVEFVGGLFGFQNRLGIVVDVGLGTDILDFAATPAGSESLGGPSISLLGPLLNAIGLPPVDLMDGVNQVFTQQSRALSAFGQVTWSLTDALSLITGLRLGQERKDAVLSIDSRGLGITAMVVGADFPDPDFTMPLSRRETEVSPKLGLRYAFTEDFSTYLSWTRGFKGGGFNGISFNSEDLVFEPEQGDNYELGVKSRLLQGALALNVTLYHTTVSNLQVVNFNGVSFDVFNAAQARLQGVEADLTWLTPWPWLSINAAASVGRAQYTDYPNAPAPAGGGDENGEQDLSGRTLPKAPLMTLSVSPTISLPLGRQLGLSLGLDLSHRGDQFLSLDLDPVSFQRAHTLLGAQLSIGPESQRWGITLRGENLGDVGSLSFVADHNLYANSYFATQSPQRRLSLSLNVNW